MRWPWRRVVLVLVAALAALWLLSAGLAPATADSPAVGDSFLPPPAEPPPPVGAATTTDTGPPIGPGSFTTIDGGGGGGGGNFGNPGANTGGPFKPIASHTPVASAATASGTSTVETTTSMAR